MEWMTILGRLSTKDRLALWGITIEDVCVLCGMAQESHSHMFFYVLFLLVCGLTSWSRMELIGLFLIYMLSWIGVSNIEVALLLIILYSSYPWLLWCIIYGVKGTEEYFRDRPLFQWLLLPEFCLI